MKRNQNAAAVFGDGVEKKKHRRRISISTSLFISVMAIVLLFVATIVLVDSRLMNVVYIFSSAWKMWDITEPIDEMYTQRLSDEEMATRLSALETEYDVSLEIFDDAGYLVFSSDSPEDIYGRATDQSLARLYNDESSGAGSKLKRHFEFQKDNNSDIQMEYIVYVMTLDNDYTAKAFKMKTPMDESAQIAVQFVVYTALTVVFIAVIVIRIFSQRFTRPLKDISAITHDMSRLDFSKRCPPSRTREIALLSDSINELGESLNVALDDLKAKNQKLQDDYEKEKMLERLRTDFIAGASHELKTPIAIVRGYAEGMSFLLESDPAAAKQYAETIIGETERMNQLVMKLLEIIKYDSGDYIVNYDIFDIYELVQDWFDRNAEILMEKSITYENNIPQDCLGTGDSMLSSSIVNNYLSNGVSHIDGARVLRASMTETGEGYRVSIFNTGKNIADKDLDMIWNSFYRADKSMSRAEGRFGLGLAIVTSIQRLHGMQFGVENMPDGVRFWFDIKKAE